MKNHRLFVIMLVATMVIAATAPLCTAATLSKPNVTLPSGWELSDETAYPNETSEHDSQGAGLVEYTDLSNNDIVIIYYENAPSDSLSSADLQSEAENIFIRDEEYTYSESGVMTIAGVQAGYAKGYYTDSNAYDLEIVFVKGNYYINAYAFYDTTTQSNDKVMSIMNSIATETSIFSGTMLFIIIGIVIAIVVVIVVLVIFMRRKKKVVAPQMQTYQSNIPPPPPT